MSKNRNHHESTNESPETEQVNETVNETVVEQVREPQVLEDLSQQPQSEGNLALAPATIEAPVYDEAEVRAMTTKASQIRFLHSKGLKRGAIAKILSGIHGKVVLYQHVRNVLVQVQKKAS